MKKEKCLRTLSCHFFLRFFQFLGIYTEKNSNYIHRNSICPPLMLLDSFGRRYIEAIGNITVRKDGFMIIRSIFKLSRFWSECSVSAVLEKNGNASQSSQSL
ncbi:unnamed protein product [Albugo candida]|uniref:Uncharacterized protein n=1 Tax=Albugo candida TaxID=65357 RepID=A0A024FVU2_9STRA|nr:unnamed protein product [Albugo candida]|eukprot:CCI11250.1 unnamed protein product [Albugo candida]